MKKMKIYMDNGATTQVSKEVVRAMNKYFTEVYGNASSLHKFGREAKEALEESRRTIAKAINAEPEEIIFTSGGTESDNLAIKGVAYANKNKGNHIITSKIEHPAVLSTLKELGREGFMVSYINVDREGFVDLKELEKNITDKTILITIMHANNEIGTIEPIDKIAEIAKKHNIVFHSDAVQSFTKVPIDVKKIGLDLMSFSGHKIHGPKGVGALYVKKGTALNKQAFGGRHEFNLRAGTENMPGIVGFAKAADMAMEKFDERIKHMTRLRNLLIDNITKKIPDTQLNGPKDRRLCNNANIAFNFIEGESLLMQLDMNGIAVSTGSACSSQSLKPSHVLMAIGLKHEVAHGTIRFTLSEYNTEKEINYTVDNLTEIVKKLRKISPLWREKHVQR